MKVLVTGFDPFDKDTINPAYEAVKKLPDKIKGAEIIKLEIPTSFKRSEIIIEEAIEKYSPNIILSVGQAGGRNEITIEKVAINLLEARIKDNDGYQPLDTPVREDGETAYFTNLPIKGMVKHIKDNNIPASISYTAGTFVCNSVMYNILYLINKKYNNLKGGFMHVPFLPEQAMAKKPTPSSMSSEMIAKAIELGIEAILMDIDGNGLILGETH
ncbi:MAG: pyroglutamyl-peptidase I [Eubacteriales bacterium]|nr:pyroglutamyl-peptidase I [Eubacteriales bacterium]